MVYSYTILYEFPKDFIFKVSNTFLTKIEWGDGTENIITNKNGYSYHKYNTSSIYNVIVTLIIPLTYKMISYPKEATNGYGYIINCPNSVNVNDNIKLNYSFNEQGYASDRIKKIKDQTIYANLKSTNPLITTLPNTYSNYNSLMNIQKGYLYCNFDSVYVFQ
jgi:hypothetical protein